MAPSLSFIIPAFNEAKRLGPTLAELVAFASLHHPDAEIIVVDDGSTDDTAGCVEALSRFGTGVHLRLVRLPYNRGKGFAVKSGVAVARGERVVFMDADLSTPLSEISKLLAALDSGYGLAIGSRHLAGATIDRRQPPMRRLAGRIFNWLVRTLVINGVADTQCGCKGLRGDAAKTLFALLATERFSFDVELLLLARRLGVRSKEVAVRWRDDPNTRVSLLRDSMNMFVDLARMRWRVWRRVSAWRREHARDLPTASHGSALAGPVKT